MKLNDLTDKRFGRLLVKRRRKKNNKWNQSVWICVCDCSPEKEIQVDAALLSSGKTTSCGCYRKEFRMLKYGEASRNRLFGRYRKEAKERKLDFLLSIEQAEKLFKSNCKYCGIEPKQVAYAENMNGEYLYNGIDRKNNNIGYTEVNCVSCCATCNHMKHVLGEEEFLEHIKRIYGYSCRIS